jgi:hypothetical protein
MPYINFMWHPKADASRVSGIVDALRTIADAHNVSFYVNAKEESEEQSVVVNDDIVVSKAGVTIYVNGGE